MSRWTASRVFSSAAAEGWSPRCSRPRRGCGTGWSSPCPSGQVSGARRPGRPGRQLLCVGRSPGTRRRTEPPRCPSRSGSQPGHRLLNRAAGWPWRLRRPARLPPTAERTLRSTPRRANKHRCRSRELRNQIPRCPRCNRGRGQARQPPGTLDPRLRPPPARAIPRSSLPPGPRIADESPERPRPEPGSPENGAQECRPARIWPPEAPASAPAFPPVPADAGRMLRQLCRPDRREEVPTAD